MSRVIPFCTGKAGQTASFRYPGLYSPPSKEDNEKSEVIIMTRNEIIFTAPGRAEYLKGELPDTLKDRDVLVRTLVSTVSPGTERANITGDPNVRGNLAEGVPVPFPRRCGHSTAAVVEKTGPAVTSVRPGDTVIAFRGTHASLSIRPESCVLPFDQTIIAPEDAAVLYISIFPLAAVRKTRVELGESALVMGCGLLGQLAVRQLRAAGAFPIVAADLLPDRRAEALAGGADFAFDPAEPDFAAKVKEATDGGASVCIEVTGRGEGLDLGLNCMRRFGRVALLGCTRDKNFTIDYYRKVHFPGITLIGAHSYARPQQESYPGHFTAQDDILAMLRLIKGGRLSLSTLSREVAGPENCAAVYERLVRGKDFPSLMQFDWRR